MSVSLPSVRTWPKNNSLAEVMPASVKPTKRSAAEPSMVTSRRMTPPCIAIGTFIVPLPQIHCGERFAHLAEHITPITPVSQSKLAEVVLAPALHTAVIEYCTAVAVAGSDAHCFAPGSEINSGKIGSHLFG